jgi:virginiamycin B lyase
MTVLTTGRCAIALSIVVLVSACGAAPAAPTDVVEPSRMPTEAAPSVAPEPSASAETNLLAQWTVATLDLGGGPDMPMEAFGSLWVLTVDGPIMNDGTEPSLNRIDPATNEIIANVPLPGRLCQGIGASPEAVWACGPDGLVRIDPATNEVVATIDTPAALVVSRIAYGAGSVWAFTTSAVGADTIVRVDPVTNAITTTIPLGRVATWMAFGFDALWVTSAADDVLMRIDPATNEVAEWTPGLETAGCISVGEDALWIALRSEEHVAIEEGEPTIARVDPATGELTDSISTGPGESGGCVLATPDAVWYRAPEPFLSRIDPVTYEVTDRIDSRSGPGDVGFAFGSVWVTWERGELIRLDP